MLALLNFIFLKSGSSLLLYQHWQALKKRNFNQFFKRFFSSWCHYPSLKIYRLCLLQVSCSHYLLLRHHLFIGYDHRRLLLLHHRRRRRRRRRHLHHHHRHFHLKPLNFKIMLHPLP